MLINIQDYYTKLANKEALSEIEIIDLLSAYRKMLDLAAHLASCHAATAEQLPPSASISNKSRMSMICTTSADGLMGRQGPRYLTTAQNAVDRCRETAARLDQAIEATQVEKANAKAKKAPKI